MIDLTVVCPEYGKAMSFLCQSLAKKLDDSCAPCDTNVEPVLVGSSGMPFYNLFVVPDDTPYCLKEFTHYPSGELEKVLDASFISRRISSLHYCLLLDRPSPRQGHLGIQQTPALGPAALRESSLATFQPPDGLIVL